MVGLLLFNFYGILIIILIICVSKALENFILISNIILGISQPTKLPASAPAGEPSLQITSTLPTPDSNSPVPSPTMKHIPVPAFQTPSRATSAPSLSATQTPLDHDTKLTLRSILFFFFF